MPSHVMDVSTQSVVYKKMREEGQWDLLRDLIGGTFAMRSRSQEWLPKEKGENDETYSIRLRRSFLFPAFSEGADKIVARPFSKPLQISKGLPKELKIFETDVDGAGTSTPEFGRHLLYWAVVHGMAHVYVDFSNIQKGISKSEEAKQGARATFRLIPAPSLFFWRHDPDTGALIEIRIIESRLEKNGSFGDREVPHIRRILPNIWELYKNDPDNSRDIWELVESREHNAFKKIGGIPLFTLFTNRSPGSRMEASPPLLRLAEKNLEHWQNASDQSNILHYARVPIMLGTGFTQDEIDAGITVAPNTLITSPKPEATLGWVEHSGKSVNAGEVHLAEIREDMRALGLAPFLPKAGMGDVKATGQAIDEVRNQSEVQMWVRAEEILFQQIFGAAAKWHGVKLPEDWKVDIYQEFTISIQSERDLEAILRLRENGDIDQRTELFEMKRRGTLAESTEIEEVIKATDKERKEEKDIKTVAGFNKPLDEEE